MRGEVSDVSFLILNLLLRSCVDSTPNTWLWPRVNMTVLYTPEEACTYEKRNVRNFPPIDFIVIGKPTKYQQYLERQMYFFSLEVNRTDLRLGNEGGRDDSLYS